MIDNGNQNPLKELSRFWSGLKGRQKVMGGSIILLIAILIASLSLISSNYLAPLFTSASLSKREAAEILPQEGLKRGVVLFDDPIWIAQFSFEEYIKAKIDGLLTKIVGLNHFYTTVQVLMAKENVQVQIKNISIGVVVDKSVLDKNSDFEAEKGHPITESIKKEIASQLAAIIRGYDVPVQAAVDFVEFQKNISPQIEVEQNWSFTIHSVLYIVFLLTAIGVGIALIIYLFSLQNKNKALHNNSQSEKIMKDNIEDILADIQQKIEKNPESSLHEKVHSYS